MILWSIEVLTHLKIILRDSRDKRTAPNRVHAETWSFFGPYRFLKKDLVIFEILQGCVYLF